MFLRLRYIILAVMVGIAGFGTALAQGTQQPNRPKAPAAPTPTPTPTPPVQKVDLKNMTAEQVAEFAVFWYAAPGGRTTLNQIRRTTLEKGSESITNSDGKVDLVPYHRYVIRGESLDKEKIRLDQEFPSAKYSMIYNDAKIFGIYNNTVFAPREDASKTFENQIVHGIEALLRYKENGSTIALAPREKLMGVEYYVLDLTDKQQRKTRFYVSAKYFRVMLLTYVEDGIKYRRKFYDYNYAQGTLVPFHTVLWANDKIVEETNIATITFGQKVDDDLFGPAKS